MPAVLLAGLPLLLLLADLLEWAFLKQPVRGQVYVAAALLKRATNIVLTGTCDLFNLLDHLLGVLDVRHSSESTARSGAALGRDYRVVGKILV